MNKQAIFVDVQNIYYTSKEVFNKQFNYRRFWQLINQQGEVVSATAYAIESQNDSQKKFQDALHHIGFTVKVKPFIKRSDGTAKGDWDVGITIDIIESAKNIDTVILLSGDGDFDLLLKYIDKNYKTKTEVYSVQALTARSLINAATIFHPIEADLLLS